MQSFILQLHLTHKCNLRCTHCYQEDYNKKLSLIEVKNILEQFNQFLIKFNYKGHINITGGEPFSHDNIFEILGLIEEKYNFNFGILTNGTLINEDISDKLSNYNNLSFVQISLDGNKKTHESIRGIGSFDKALNGLRLLKKNKITTMISYTTCKKNYKEIKEVIKIAKKNKIDRFWTDRLIPIENSEDILSTEEFIETIKILTKEHIKCKMNPFCKTYIQTNRALQFCGGVEDNIYHCGACKNLLVITADGDLLPCRRLPIKLGNVFNDNILNIYETNKIVKEFTNDLIPNECLGCKHSLKCRGGLKCLSYAMTKTLNQKDINCNNKF